MDNFLSDDVAVEAGLALGGELDCACLEGKEGIVHACAYVHAWEDGRTTLAEDNLTRSDLLAMIDLNPEVFRV